MERGKQDKRAARKFHLGFNPQPGLKLKSERENSNSKTTQGQQCRERERVSIQCLLSIIVRVYDSKGV